MGGAWAAGYLEAAGESWVVAEVCRVVVTQALFRQIDRHGVGFLGCVRPVFGGSGAPPVTMFELRP
jgi:hypothetical protein